MGLLAGINTARALNNEAIIPPPPTTALGALLGHIQNTYAPRYQPMNINFGLLPPLERTVRKQDKRRLIVERALRDLARWKEAVG
jgi:methylenetetrahydrofolate--tRNA-(uracil-5-)-methyltransferase